ncbi:MAG: hypothetical protein OJF50_000235 [Nitrospira sp.]|jgi:hypothetical protein|nr:hypothetical protein [Nitrospira sp.]
MRWGTMSLLAGMLAWSSVAVHAGAVLKLCERKYQLPGGVVTVPETVQYVLGTPMTCLEADLLSPLPSARILDPAPEALSSLLKTVRSLPVVLPKQPSGSPAATISNAGSLGERRAGTDLHHGTVRFESGPTVGRRTDQGK